MLAWVRGPPVPGSSQGPGISPDEPAGWPLVGRRYAPIELEKAGRRGFGPVRKGIPIGRFPRSQFIKHRLPNVLIHQTTDD